MGWEPELCTGNTSAIKAGYVKREAPNPKGGRDEEGY